MLSTDERIRKMIAGGLVAKRNVAMAIIVGFVCGFTVCSAQASSTSWSIATADTRMTLGISSGKLVISKLCPLRGGHNWAGTDMSVPLMSQVSVGDEHYKTQWVFQSAAMDKRSDQLVIVFTNAQPSLRLKSIWRARPGRGPIEHRIELTNLSGKELAITHQDSLSLTNLLPGVAEICWIRRGGSSAIQEGGTFRETLSSTTDINLNSTCTWAATGAPDSMSPVPWLDVQVSDKEGLYVGWEFSGLGRVAAKAAEGGKSLCVNVGNHPDFKTDVYPGETFVVPTAFVGCYTGDIDEGSYTLHRFILEKLRPAFPAHYPDPTLAYNLYMDAGGTNATEADVLTVAKTAHDLGFETYISDAMWFPVTGDWRWDPKRFPNDI